MKKVLLMFTILMMFTLVACGNTEKESITVVLDWTPNTNHTGLYVALENGYFEDEGLNVEIIQPDGYAETIVAAGTAQFGISAEEYVISSRAYETPVVSIGAIIYNNTSGFISKKESNIVTPKDFEGKTYCGWGMDTESEIIKALVEADGGDFSKVEVTTNSLDIFTDVNNECDFFWVFEGWQVQQAKLENIDYNYISMADYNEELSFHTPVIITNEDMISNNPKTVEKFMKAAKKGYEFTIDNPEESADILLSHAPELNAELVKESQKFLSANYAKGTDTWGMQSEDYWHTFYQWLLDRNIVTEINIEDAFTNEFIK